MNTIVGYFACKNEVFARYENGATERVLCAPSQKEAIEYAEYKRAMLA